MTAPCTAGAGRSEIGLSPEAFPVEGFTAGHDPLHARTLVLDDGLVRVALVALELTSVFDDLVDAVRDTVAEEAGVERGNVVVAASHTFSAPHVFPVAQAARSADHDERRNELVRAAVLDAVLRSVSDARRTMRPARVGAGRGRCDVNVNRDVPTAGGWWLGADEAGPSDKTVQVVRVEEPDGRPVAIIVNHAVQSSVTLEARAPGGGRLVSADLAGAACRHVESRYGGGSVAFFLTGAAGDQAPRPAGDIDAYARVDLLGAQLGAEAVRVCETVRCTDARTPVRVVHDRVEVPAQVPPASMRDLRPSTDHPFRPDGTADVPLVVVRIGDIAIAGLQAELSSTTGTGVRERSPFAHTLVATMVNGAAKYMADVTGYDRITYEAMNSRYARGAAETVAARMDHLLTALRSGL
ncbi:hypothetical protein [Streptomyces sp. cg40]|uniref:hypothetical protein n=1 Tax=Streptomyces sp. cg40 TaxID=3419764 RepID=UPI003D00D0C0